MTLEEYSEPELRRVVRASRAMVLPTAVQTYRDVIRPYNDVLLTYSLNDIKLGPHNLSTLLANPAAISRWLTEAIPRPRETVQARDGLTSESPTAWLERSILRRNEGKFAFGYEGSVPGVGGLLIADELPRDYTFSDGTRLPYFSLVNEVAANVSVLDTAFVGEADQQIRVRSTSMVTLLALARRAEEHEATMRYLRAVPNYRERLRGVPLAHELMHRYVQVKSPEPGSPSFTTELGELELAVDDQTRRFLQKHAEPHGLFTVFHMLRAGRALDGGLNHSARVLREIVGMSSAEIAAIIQSH